MTSNVKILSILFFFLYTNNIKAQDSSSPCKVLSDSLVGKYTGKCKNGLADAQGEAIGAHRYEGSFKHGYPNGKGTYHYNDSVYHIGNFQDGIKEGKGETHYVHAGLPDSIVKGYWSADVYRGKKYVTYNFISSQTFDTNEITPSDESGNMVTIEISTTSGAPDGTPNSYSGGSGYVLTLNELVSTNGDIIRKNSNYATAHKSSSTYLLNKFPAKLFGTLSNGQTIELELYKAAKWTVRLYLNN